MRDYRQWHDAYDDPASGLSRRLRSVRRLLAADLDARLSVSHDATVRVLSACAGDGRDIVGVLADRNDADRTDGDRPDDGRTDGDRVTATLVELDPELAERARRAVAELPHASGVEVRTADAGRSDAYAGAVPADVVLLVGIFGNITAADIRRTIAAAPQLCAPGATLLWSRGVRDADLVPDIRGWLREAGFGERHLVSMLGADGITRTLGVARYDGAPQELVPGQEWFSFVR